MSDSTIPQTVEVALAQQLRYAEALAQFSHSLLTEGANAPAWEPVVERALVTLREAVDASRIAMRLYRALEELVEFPPALIRVHKPGIDPSPESHFTYEDVPQAIVAKVLAGESVYGPLEQLFPTESNVFAALSPRIKTMLITGFFVNGVWRGHIAVSHADLFLWDEPSLRFMRTGIEMMGAFLHQWETSSALRSREIQLRALSDNLPNGFIYQYRFDLEGRPKFVFVSSGIERLLGLTPEAVLTDAAVIHSLIAPDDRPRFERAEQQALREMRLFKEVLCHILPDGRERWLYISSCPRYMSDGSIICDGIAFDVTEQHRANQELAHARDTAETATRAKSAFLATMSHELRTPLNAIIGMADLLHETDLDAEQAIFTNTIRTAGQALLTIINDILDASRIEAGRLELELAPFDLHHFLASAVDLVAYNAHQKGLSLTWTCESDLPRNVLGDEARLRQILLNLLSNAVKFTSNGGVMLHAALAQAEAQQCWVQISVEDTGIGIAPEQQQRIFEPFVQADSSTSRRYGGTGLGLTICSQLVTRMGGQIAVRSRPDEGSTFTLTLPFTRDPATSKAPAPPVLAANALLPLNILIAEDNLVNQELIRRMLASQGHRATVVSNGLAAVSAVRHATYDVVFMDLQMPELDGIAATYQIRAFGNAIHQPKIVALTANFLDNEHERSLQAGMNAFLTKPVKPQDIQQTLASVLSPPSREQVQRTASKPLIAWNVFEALLTGIGQQESLLITTIINLFVQDVPPQITNIEAFAAQRDCTNIRRETHRLRGGCLQIGAQALALLCHQIEQCTTQDDLMAHVAQLRPCYEETLALLRERQATNHCGH
ncbi:MAG: response regulator [Candidatus Viridilinea halotolerans]|uniref:Circadian input-output histidine kinase CikA n=1 Tax=Candidatus Viridilinea halotolerans TaxID=2491704 RepID=A0A426TR55_9CHLR|nr:MAG: response regulator [Candidatus Viridilinea halotolerans]